MKLTFDYYHNLEKVELRLCNPDGRELFPLPGKNRNLTLRFNDLSELTTIKACDINEQSIKETLYKEKEKIFGFQKTK